MAVLDNNFEVWFKKDSLWFSEDIDAVFDQDPQRVCILQGPVAVKWCTKVNEPIAEMFGGIRDNLIQNILRDVYGGDESKIPTVEYLAPSIKTKTIAGVEKKISEAKGVDIAHSTRSNAANDSTTHVYKINSLPTGPDALSDAEWLEYLSGTQLNWLKAFLVSTNVSHGTTGLVENQSKKLFKLRKGQRVEVTVANKDGKPLKVEIYGAIRN